MQLPRGILANSFRGPVALKDIGEAIAKDGLTGYMRVSLFGKDNVSECVTVYLSGRPVMSFVSDGAVDHRDADFRLMAEAIKSDGAIVEVCKLTERQVHLLQELYRDLAVARLEPAASPAPAQKELPKPAAPKPVAKPEARPGPEAAAPAIRGRFVRAEDVGSVGEYLQHHPGETGHLRFLAQRGGKQEELHVIMIKGKVEAVYGETAASLERPEELSGTPGLAEFYAVDEALLRSVLGRREEKDSGGQGPRVERPSAGIGIPAKALLEKSRASSSPVKEDINKAVDEISNAMDDDVAMVRKVEHDFASHVDDLLSKLELSHLRSANIRKKK